MTANFEAVLDELGRTAFEAYAHNTEWRSVHGEPLPNWDDVPDRVQTAWRAAARGILRDLARWERGQEFDEILDEADSDAG